MKIHFIALKSRWLQNFYFIIVIISGRRILVPSTTFPQIRRSESELPLLLLRFALTAGVPSLGTSVKTPQYHVSQVSASTWWLAHSRPTSRRLSPLERAAPASHQRRQTGQPGKFQFCACAIEAYRLFSAQCFSVCCVCVVFQIKFSYKFRYLYTQTSNKLVIKSPLKQESD